MLRKTITLVFLGPDGAGKSTYIKKISQNLKKKKINLVNYHLYPNFFKKKKPVIVSNPHSKMPRSEFTSFLKLFYWLIKYHFFLILIKNISKKIIIFDRHAYDILIDPVRYRFKLNKKITNSILKLFPKPDLWIIVTNHPSVIWKRKKEVKYKVLVKQVRSYNKLSKKFKNSIVCRNFSDTKKILKYLIKNYEI